MTIEEKISDCLFDAIDIRNVLKKSILNLPKDSDGTDTTIGDCLDNIIETFEELEEAVEYFEYNQIPTNSPHTL